MFEVAGVTGKYLLLQIFVILVQIVFGAGMVFMCHCESGIQIL